MISVSKKIIFNSNSDYNLSLFRMGVIKKLKEENWEVHAVCPMENYIAELLQEGVLVHHIPLSRHGLNPFQDILYLIRLYLIFKEIKPSVIHSFTIKPNIYGNIAAYFARIPRIINSITGLGYIYIGSGVKKTYLRYLANLLYKFAFLFAYKVIFQNEDDFLLFTEKYKILPPYKTIIIKSSGVDCDFFSIKAVNNNILSFLRKQLEVSNDDLVITMIARMIWEKGVAEFTEAAKELKKKYCNISFLLVGPLETGSPSAVPESYFKINSQFIRWVGHQKDIKHILALSAIVILPSYREGVPRVLLEAMSMSRPIITTDAVGCREVIEHNKNGIMIRTHSPEDISAAIQKFIENRNILKLFGECGRRNAETKWRGEQNYAMHYDLYI